MNVKEEDLSSMFAEAGLRIQPPLIRDAVFRDHEFLSKFGLTAHGSIHVAELDSSFPSSDFYEAFRCLDSAKESVEIYDDSGRRWQAKLDESDPRCPAMMLTDGERELQIRELFPISNNPATRINGLKSICAEVFLSRESIRVWEGILKERPATEAELDQWHKVVQSAPQSVSRDLRREISESGGGNVDTLVPSSESYIENLVGKYDGSRSIQAYADASWAEHCRSVIDWDPYFGFLQNLYSSSHSSMVRQIPTESLGVQDIVRAFRFLEEKGDPISRLGAIEVGMRIVGNLPKVGSVVCRLIEQIRDDDAESNGSGFFALSNFFVFVDSFLSQRGSFRNSPPFYRRLASIAHASLLQRQLQLENIDVGAVAQWTKRFGNMQFHCQSFTDMRVEPRWIPSFATPEQLKAEFLGRIVNAATANREAIQDTEIFGLVIGNGGNTILTSCDSRRLFLPGPLEGDRGSAPQAPKDFTDAIDEQLRIEQSIASSFTAFVNGSLLFRVESSQADTAANLLVEGKQRIRELSKKNDLIDILNGLALAAAVSESESLRDQVFVLVRKYRRDPEFSLTLSEAISIFHMASAADYDLQGWCRNLGNWLTEFSFSELSAGESAELFSYLETILKIVPGLWHHCGRAHAALQSIQKDHI